MDTREFFEAIFGDNTGEAVLVLPNREGKPTSDYWFSYPEQLSDMADFAWSNEHTDVWFSPNLFTERSRKKEHSKTLPVLGADADTCNPANFRVKPDLIIESSPERWQVYWLVNDGGNYPSADMAAINRRISQAHKGQGCDVSFINNAKLMRVPDTSNGKHPGAIVTVEEYDPAGLLEVADLVAAYPEDEISEQYEIVVGDMPSDIAEFVKENKGRLLAGLPNSESLRHMLFEEYHGDKRSEILFRLTCELYRLGLDDKEVFTLAWTAPTNKFNGEDPRGMQGLWDTALLRAKTAAFDPEYAWDMATDFTDPDEPAERRVAATVKRFEFLSESELESIKGITNFVDEWVHWAGTRTDAPAEYHRAAALSLLATVYSEFGHATPQWGKMKLNLWFMSLGRSTKDRKSTSRSYMKAALRALKTDDYNYELGEDVTPGGITLALQQYADKSVVLARDEVQGMFKELINQSYMSGGLETFTELYDGWARGRIRATGDQKQTDRVPVSFNMFLMGILTESTEVLTITNFRSGFLTRFLYVIGSRPDTYVAPPIQQLSEDKDKGDPVFDGLVEHLSRNRDYWEMHGGEGDTVPIRAEDDAWTRYQQFEKDVNAAVLDTSYREYIGTTAERMLHATLKVAALLAMDNKRQRIGMTHMLQAIGYAGEWFTNTVTFASMVSASEWQRDVDKLEAFISGKGGTVSYAVAYRQFPNLRQREFEDMIASLEGRGILTRERNGSRWALKVSYGD